MKTNLIIGAGQLGSRHLQGLLKWAGQQTVYVVDPSPGSLSVARERASEIPHSHTIHFMNDWDDLPAGFDLVIIATSANVRRQVLESLVPKYGVGFLVLEKILFQDIESYEVVDELLNKYNIKTWVNHPRRQWDGYKKIKAAFINETAPTVFQAVGANWGLACNALHFIDLFEFVAGSSLKELDVDWVDAMLESKRKGVVEFTGAVKGRLADGSIFFISALPGDLGPVTVTISNAGNRWLIQETGTTHQLHLAKANAFASSSSDFSFGYQSSLTTQLASSLFETGDCDLSTYKEASHSHRLFIESCLVKYNQLSGQSSKVCPIT